MFKPTGIALLTVLITGCGSTTTTTIDTSLTRYLHVEPVIDTRDGRSYPVVVIGGQVWTASNISFPTEPSWCYEDQPGDCEANGRLYPWAKVREACPGGWHVPSDADWMELERALGVAGDSLHSTGPRGAGVAYKLLEGGETGFDARLAGCRESDGSYADRTRESLFWSSTEVDRMTAWAREMRSDQSWIGRRPAPKTQAMTVRCIRDEPFTDEGAGP